MDNPTATTTSFIPKTRLAGPTYRSKGVGLWFLISFFLFLISLGLSGGAYLYKQSLQKSVDEDIASLELAKKSLEPSLINQLNRFAFSINAAKILFSQHNTSAEIFKIISGFTLKDVRFLNFDFKIAGGNPVVSMNGEANSYTSVALQAKLFEQSDAVSQVIFSKFKLKEGGKVDFSVEITLSPLSFVYKP
jgi:hypothetical protein